MKNLPDFIIHRVRAVGKGNLQPRAEANIIVIIKYLDIALMDANAVNMGAGQHYRELSTHGSDCIQCGDCESKCQFVVPVIENMERAAKIFGL